MGSQPFEKLIGGMYLGEVKMKAPLYTVVCVSRGTRAVREADWRHVPGRGASSLCSLYPSLFLRVNVSKCGSQPFEKLIGGMYLGEVQTPLFTPMSLYAWSLGSKCLRVEVDSLPSRSWSAGGHEPRGGGGVPTSFYM